MELLHRLCNDKRKLVAQSVIYQQNLHSISNLFSILHLHSRTELKSEKCRRYFSLADVLKEILKSLKRQKNVPPKSICLSCLKFFYQFLLSNQNPALLSPTESQNR